MMNINPMMCNQNLSCFNFNIQNTNSLNIYDCFDFNQKKEFLTEENSIYCDQCRAQEPTLYYEELYSLPQILAFYSNYLFLFKNVDSINELRDI